MDKLPKLYERLRELYQFKHKSSPRRRIPRIEKMIGVIKKEIRRCKDATLPKV